MASGTCDASVSSAVRLAGSNVALDEPEVGLAADPEALVHADKASKQMISMTAPLARGPEFTWGPVRFLRPYAAPGGKWCLGDLLVDSDMMSPDDGAPMRAKDGVSAHVESLQRCTDRHRACGKVGWSMVWITTPDTNGPCSNRRLRQGLRESGPG